MNLLIAYASPHGSTAEIATFIGRTLGAYDSIVTVRHVDAIDSVADYDAFILGSAIHSSMWLPSLSRFMFRFENDLASKPVFLFLTCIIALEEGGVERAKQDFVWDEALDKLNINASHIQAFAGRLDWSRITGDEHWVIKGTYKGQKLPEIKSGDYRDWRVIALWANDIAEALQLSAMTSDHLLENALDIVQTTKDETITHEGVKKLAWADNPGEVAGI